jgi:hypothetical protein
LLCLNLGGQVPERRVNSDTSVNTSKSELVADAVRPLVRDRMNLDLVYQLLVAATEQRHGFLKIPKGWAEGEGDVREMANAGLVEATVDDGKEGGFTAINRVTAAGETFLRLFEGHRFAHLAVSAA